MKIPTLFLAVAIFALSATSFSAEKKRSMDEMHGNCANYAMDLKQDLKTWEGVPLKLKASMSPGTDTPALETGKKAELELRPSANFKTLVKPGRSDRPGERTYGGLATFKVDAEGMYRVAGGSSFWFELVEKSTLKAVESDAFEMQTGCDQIYKVVTFKLKAGTPYLLQITSAKKPAVQLLVSRQG